MNKNVSLYLTLGIAICVFVVGIIIGSASTAQYRATMYDKTPMNLGVSDRWLDLRYINAMIQHHRGAILLAEQAETKGQRKEVRELSKKILIDEPILIRELYMLKKSMYGDTSNVNDPTEIRLGKSDETFDLRFLNALITHHRAGVEMTKEVRTKSSTSEILNNADAVERFLIGTLPMLLEWRDQWYPVK